MNKIYIAILENVWEVWSLTFDCYFRSFHYLYELMDNHSDVEYTLKASYLEVYNEKVQVRANLSNILHVLYYCWLSKKNIHNLIGSMVYLYNCRGCHVLVKIAVWLVLLNCWIQNNYWTDVIQKTKETNIGTEIFLIVRQVFEKK